MQGQTIASDDKEFIILRHLVLCNLGIRGNDLVFSRDICILLVFEVTQGPSQGEVA